MMLQAVLILAALAGEADATEVEKELHLQVQRLVRRLDARELADREAAERALLDLGPAVLDLLPPVDGQTPAEVKLRLDRVRFQLQKQQAATAAAASTFTLRGEQMPLAEIFASLEQQTGNRIVPAATAKGPEVAPVRMTVDYTRAPFWPAFDEILDLAGLTIHPFTLEPALALARAREGFLPRSTNAFYNGPFRFEAIRTEARRDLRFAGDASLGLTLEIAWEPRFRPISLQQRMSEIELFDEAGRPLAVAAPAAQIEIPISAAAISTELRIPLQSPPRTVEEIAQLKGTIHALMQGKLERFEFGDLMAARNVEKRAGGVTVVLERVRRNNAVWEVRIAVRFDAAQGALASHRTWIYDNPARLVTASGEEIPFDAYEAIGQMENEVGIAYLFGIENDLEGYTFVYETAGGVLSASFEYQLSDVGLP